MAFAAEQNQETSSLSVAYKFSQAKFELWEQSYEDVITYDFVYHDEARCPDCKSKRLCIETITTADGNEQKKMTCERHLDKDHRVERVFVKAGPCRRCRCEWTLKFSSKQIRKADEGETDTIACLRGCKVPITG